MGTTRGKSNAIKTTLDRTTQAIERMSLKIDDQSLTDGMY